MNLADYPEDSRVFSLHVGDSGSGKSCATGCYPTPLYIFDIDKRIRGMFGHPVVHSKIKNKEVDFDYYPASAEGHKKLYKQLERFHKETANGTLKYKTIALQTLTSFDNQLQAYILEELKMKSGGIIDEMLLGHYTGMGGFTSWRFQDQAFDELLKKDLKGLGCNVVVEGHWTTKWKSPGKDAKGKPLPRTEPDGMQLALRDKIAEIVPTEFDEIFFFEKKMGTPQWDAALGDSVAKPYYRVHFDNELARTTFKGLPPAMNWTDKDFWQILMNSKNTEAKDAQVTIAK